MVGRCISYWNSPFRGHVSFLGCNDWKTGGDVLVFDGVRPSWWLVYRFVHKFSYRENLGRRSDLSGMFWKLGGSTTNYVGCVFSWMWFVANYLCCFLSFFWHFFWPFFGFFVDALFCLEVAGLIFVFGWAHPQESPPGFLHLARNRDSELDLHLPFLLGG